VADSAMAANRAEVRFRWDDEAMNAMLTQ
jgi:hypothetical protein